MDVDPTSCLTDACTDFEQLSAQSFDLSGSQRHGQLQTKQIDEVVGETVKQQPKGIGSKAMAAESIGIETILELFNSHFHFELYLQTFGRSFSSMFMQV